MNDIPVLTRENAPQELLLSLYDRLCLVSDMLKDRYAKSVSGLWYLREHDCDGRIQVIVKTSLKRGTIEYITLCAEISSIIVDALVLDYECDEYERSLLNAEQAFAVYPQMTN